MLPERSPVGFITSLRDQHWPVKHGKVRVLNPMALRAECGSGCLHCPLSIGLNCSGTNTDPAAAAPPPSATVHSSIKWRCPNEWLRTDQRYTIAACRQSNLASRWFRRTVILSSVAATTPPPPPRFQAIISFSVRPMKNLSLAMRAFISSSCSSSSIASFRARKPSLLVETGTATSI